MLSCAGQALRCPSILNLLIMRKGPTTCHGGRSRGESRYQMLCLDVEQKDIHRRQRLGTFGPAALLRPRRALYQDRPVLVDDTN
jgi:hypothetical protein